MITTHPKDYDCNRLLTTAEAAQLATHWRALFSAGRATVTPAAIRQWRHRGQLNPRDLDRRGRALYHRDDLGDAERATRDIALNPELATRQRTPRPTDIGTPTQPADTNRQDHAAA